MTVGRALFRLGVAVGLTLAAVGASQAATLAPPDSITATAVSETGIDLSWRYPNNAGDTWIERSTNSGSGWSAVNTVGIPKSTTTYQDRNLAPWTTYYYRLRAKNGSTISDYSTVVSARTRDTTAPTNGTAAATPGESQITVSWSGFSDALSGVATYKLVFATGSFPASCGGTSFTVAGTSFTHTDLTNGTTYYYRVCAVDNAGNISSGATTSAVPRDLTAPTGSMTINANAAYTSAPAVTLNLSASDTVGVTGYYVSTTSTAPSAGTAGWSPVTSTTSFSSNVSYTLAAGDGTKTVYTWYKDLAGNVSAAASDTIVLDQTAPTNGTLSATPGSSQISLNWSGFTDATSGLASTNTYKLVFATGTAPASCATGTQLLLGTATTYTHTGLTNGTTYAYRVCAFDNAGNTSTGATATATPQPGDTAAPTGSLTINSNAPYTATTAVTLNLSATDSIGVRGYYLSTSSTPPLATAAGWVNVPSTTSFSSSVSYTLTAGDGTKTVYAWYKDAVGNVSGTASDTIVLDQTAPTNGVLTASPGNTQVSLGWSGFSDPTSGLASTNTYKLVFNTSSPASCLVGTTIYTGTAQSYVHTGRTNATTYFYRVCATDNIGNISTGATASATPQASDTTAPTGSVTINANTGYTSTTAVTLNLTATDGVGVTAYYVSTSSTAPLATAPGWTSVAATPSYSANVSYTLGAGDGTKTVYVWYKDAAANVSATRSDTIVLDQTVPTNGALTSTPGSAQIQLSWSGFTDATSGVSTYKLMYATGATPASCSVGTQLALGTATTYTHTGLTNGTAYYYRVCANDNAGNMSTGAIASASPGAGDTTPPACSISINGTAPYTATTAVTLNLAATDNVGVTGYYVSTSSTPPSATAPGWSAATPTTNFSSNVPYTLPSGDGTKTVYAWYKDAAGNVSTMVSDAIVLDQTAPINGTLTAAAGNTQVALNWSGFTDTTSSLATTNTYKLVYATGALPTSCATGTQIYLGTGTSFTHTGRANGTAYYYRVCASDKAGNGSTGATASAVPQAPIDPTLVGFVPGVGTAMDVAVAGTTAFLASDPFGLSAVNVTSPTAPAVLGSSDVPFLGQSIAVRGTRAVVTGQTRDGLAHLWVLDVTNTATPTVVGELPTTIAASSNTGFLRVALNGTGTLAVAAMGTAGIWVIDLNNPAVPVVRGTYNTPGTASGVTLNSGGTVAYVADGTGDLQIVNIATPSAPTLLSSLTLNGIHVDIALSGSYAYLVNSVGALTVVNVSNTSAPVFVTSRTAVAGAYGQRIAIEGTRAAILANDSTTSWLQSWDITAPTNPTLLGSVALGPVGTGKGLALVNGRVYVAAAADGMKIYTLGTSAPSWQGTADDTFMGQRIAVGGGVAVVAGQSTSTSAAQLKVLDVSPPSDVRVIGQLSSSSVSSYTAVAVSSTGTLAVVGRGASGIQIIDLSNPAAPVARGSYDTPGSVSAIALNSTATLAYVADGSGDLQIVSIANPNAPTLIGSLSLTGVHVDIALAGSLAYLVNSVGTLSVVNVSVPGAPVFVTSRAAVAGAYGQNIAVEGARAVVLANDSVSAWLETWNLSVPTNPTLLGSVVVGPVGLGEGVALVGGRAYVAAGSQGLLMYDISGTAAPVLVDAVGTVGDALGVVVTGGYAYVADFPATTTIIQVTAP